MISPQDFTRAPLGCCPSCAIWKWSWTLQDKKNIRKSNNKNKFKISALTWNEELLDVSYSISDIQDYFEYILEKHGEKTVILQ